MTDIKINVITLTSKLHNIEFDEVLAAKNFPLDDIFTVGTFYGSKDMSVRVDRMYTGPAIPTKSFPRSFIIHICPDIRNECNLVVVKVYNNGVLHLTGCESEQQGNEISSKLAEVCNGEQEIPGIIKKGTIEAEPCAIQMVNGCCSVNFELRKDKLAKLLEDKNYRVSNTSISPALKVFFMWNKKSKQPGICSCAHFCSDGKGTGNGTGQCNRTTISILHTGIIHFMGSVCYEQMVDAHAFIMEFLEKHKPQIARMSPEALLALAMKNNKINMVSV